MNIGNLVGMIILFLLIGYLIGNILFGLIISKIQGVDIRGLGSGNVGATNVTRNLGKISGGLVMVFDFFKSWFATFICLLIYKSLRDSLNSQDLYNNAGVIIYLGGFAAVIGHCFPCSYFYALFKYKFDFELARKKYSGGKGVASAAGFAACISPWMFFICFVLFWTICFISKYVSLASIVTVILLPFWTLIPHLDYFYMLNVTDANIQYIPSFATPFAIVDVFNYSNNWWYILVLFIFQFLVAALVVYRHKENIIRLYHHQENKAFNKKQKTSN